MKRDRIFFLLLGVGGLAAFLLLGWLTPYGPGVGPTSVVYIGGAQSLLAGEGFALSGSPITHFPPLYSLLLAACGFFGGDLVQVARWLNAVLLGVNLVLVALAVHLATGRRGRGAAALAGVFFLASSPLLVTHVMAWPEPLFITLTLSGAIGMSLFVTRPARCWLVVSALAFGLAVVTRYAGLLFLPAGLVIVLGATAGEELRPRLRRAASWLLLAAAPLVLLVARNILVAESATNRRLVFHPLPFFRYVTQLVNNALEFLAPISLPSGVRPAIFLSLALAFAALLVVAARKTRGKLEWRSTTSAMTLTCGLLCAGYLVFLLLSITFFDVATPVNSRILAPVLVLAIVAAFSLVWQLAQMLERPAVWWCFALLVAVSAAAKAPAAVRSMGQIRDQGLLFTSRPWRESAGVAFVRSLAAPTKIYSNGSDLLHFLTARKTLAPPEKLSSQTQLPNPHYAAELAAMCRDLSEQGAILVHFPAIDWRESLTSPAEVEATCHLGVARQLADAAVYGQAATPPSGRDRANE